MVEEEILRLKKYLDVNKDSEKILHVLRKLDKLEVSVENLQRTGIGKAVNTFRKWDHDIGEKARLLVSKWKSMVSGTLASNGSSNVEQEKERTSKNENSNIDLKSGHKHHQSSRAKDSKPDVKLTQSSNVKQAVQDPKLDKSSIKDAKKRPHSDDEHKSSHDSKKYEKSRKHGHRDNDKEEKSYKHGHKASNKDETKTGSHHSSSQSKHKDKEHSHNTDLSDLSKNSKTSSEKSDKTSSHKYASDSSQKTEKSEKPKKKTVSFSNKNDLNESMDEVEQNGDNDNGGISFEDMMNYDAASAAVLAKKKKISHSGDLNKSESKPATKSTNQLNLFEKLSSSSSSQSSRKEREHSSSSSKKKDSEKYSNKSQGHKDREKSGHKSQVHHSSKKRDSEKSIHKSHGQSSSSSSKKKDGEKSSHKSHSRDDRHSKSEEKRRKRAVSDFTVPLPPAKQTKLSTDILQTLPEIQPNYKPLRMPVIESSQLKMDSEGGDLDSQIGTKRHSRTQVYSGKRTTYLSAVPRLYDACMKVLIDNIDALEFVGGVPAEILYPVLEKCNPSQLFTLEDYNPYFVEDTEPLWKIHCQRDFKIAQPEEFETYREMYLRLHDAREAKLKALTANINASMAKKTPVRQTKLAYVHTAAKPPREVLRRQMKYGTAGPMSPQKPGVKAPRPSGSQASPSPRSQAGSSLIRQRPQQKEVKLIAPMMQKTLKFMKKLRR